jgi:hypothetical protein
MGETDGNNSLNLGTLLTVCGFLDIKSLVHIFFPYIFLIHFSNFFWHKVLLSKKKKTQG